MKVENFVESEIENNRLTTIKTEIVEDDTAMIAQINQHSLEIQDRVIGPTHLPNVDLQNAEPNIKNENVFDIEAGDINTKVKVENFIELENAEFDMKNILTQTKTEIGKDVDMIADINRHSLKIDDDEINPTYSPNLALQKAELSFKNEETWIYTVEGNETNNIFSKVKTEEINNTTERSIPSIRKEYVFILDPTFSTSSVGSCRNKNMCAIKRCFVPLCVNNIVNAPDKVFLTVPALKIRRQKWCEAVGVPYTQSHRLYCCEDHFKLEEDVTNWMFFKTIGAKVTLKEHVVPYLNIRKDEGNQLEGQLSSIKKKRKLEVCQNLS